MSGSAGVRTELSPMTLASIAGTEHTTTQAAAIAELDEFVRSPRMDFERLRRGKAGWCDQRAAGFPLSLICGRRSVGRPKLPCRELIGTKKACCLYLREGRGRLIEPPAKTG